jgi:hypothetical protein
MQFDWGTRILRVIHRRDPRATVQTASVSKLFDTLVRAFSSPADPLWLVGFIYQATAHTGLAFHVSNFTLVENEHGHRRRTQTSHA